MDPSNESESSSERELFFEALGIASKKERSVFLDGACFNQPDLRRRIDELLASHAEQDSFMVEPVLDDEMTLLDNTELSEGPGSTIGRYKLLQKVGEGGMGVVYMAEQTEPIVRKTALKIIKLGMDTKQVVARFEAERQALAMMDHPNIAKVLDAGATDTGRPYFVMELVRGVPITDYCDKSKLSTHQRLELFMSVCQAIQSAHQKGIIHRDIKPSNVMVTLHDGNPVTKVIDFGIAKATNQKLTEKTLFTNYAQMIGTPAYMSPEQAEMSGLDVDTRTDVYSLGVLLYELLTGTTPFPSKELLSLGYGEMQKLIAEKEPPKPSTRLSTMQWDDRTSVASNRSMEVSALGKLFQGDLDWIVMKALEKDRAHRYESASGLVADVKRHLNNEPVSAAAPTFRYQLQKFYRRNKPYMRVAAVVVGLLVLATIITTMLAIHASNLRDLSTEAQAETEIERQNAVQAKIEAESLAEESEQHLYFERIALVQTELLANRPADALKLLDECPQKLRNWEWHYLYRRCMAGPTEPFIFQSPVLSVSFDPKGKRLAALCQDGSIRIRSVKSGEEQILRAPDWKPDLTSKVAGWIPVQWLAVHPEGSQLAVISGGNSVALIDSVSGETVCSYPGGHADRINTIAFSPAGTQIATSSQDRTVRIWSLANSEQQFLLPHNNWTTGLVFTQDGKHLMTSQFGNAGLVRIWDTGTGLEVEEGFANHSESINHVAVSRDGSKFASCSADHTIVIRDLKGAKIARLTDSDADVIRIAFSKDGSRLISGGSDRIIRIWDSTTGQEILELQPMPHDVMDLDFFSDGDKILGGSHTKELVILDGSQWLKSETIPPVTLKGHEGEPDVVEFHPSRSLIASAARDGTFRFWDPVSGEEKERFEVGDYNVFDLSFHPGGDHILSSSFLRNNQSTVDVWAVDSDHERQSIITDSKEFWSVEFSPDGRYLVTGGVQRIQVWDWETKQRVGTLGRASEATWKLTYSPNGRHLVTAHTDGSVRLWDANRLTEPQEGREIPAGPTFLRPAFSHDSRVLALGDFEGNVILFNVDDGAEKKVIEHAHGRFVNCTAFSPDGRFLATGSGDRTVRLWNASNGEAVKTFIGHEGEIHCLAFSPDSSQLASSSYDKTIKIWAVPQ